MGRLQSNVPLLLNSRDSTNNVAGGKPAYSSTTYNAFGQNLIQGEIENVAVSEVNFPYDIPNVQDGYNTFTILALEGPPTAILQITIPAGFYSGKELADIIQHAIINECAAASPPVPSIEQPLCSYSNTSNQFTFSSAPAGTYTGVWGLISNYTFSLPANPTLLGKDLLSIMGFSSYQGYNVAGVFDDTHPLIGNSAPLTFTQYIDITSPQLCQYQYLRDGSTTNLARRINVICRLYISSNVATQEEEGIRPFVINRNFPNPRVMKWTSGSSIGQMDIDLFDDCGQPLTITWMPRPFQITFNVHEIIDNHK